MRPRGCALFVILIFAIVLVVGVISVVRDWDIHLPKLALPSIQPLPTFGPFQLNMPAIVNELPKTLTAVPGLIAPYTPTPEPIRNGRLLFLGLDGTIWSTDVQTNQVGRLGLPMNVHLFRDRQWYSPDNRFALVARRETDQLMAYLSHTDGTIPELKISTLSEEFDFGGFRDFFGFSRDGKRFFFIDASTNPGSLIVVNLITMSSFSWPVQASPEEITFAAFFDSGDHLVVKSFDPNLNAHFLELFQVAETLTAPRRLLVREGYQIIQFAVSPDAQHIAAVFRKFGGEGYDELGLLDVNSGELKLIAGERPGRVLLTQPAWSPDSRFLLFNSWDEQGEGLVYRFISFDVQLDMTATLLDPINSERFGQPLSRVFSFAPDGLGAGVRLYEDIPDNVSASLVLLDGSYHREIARATSKDGISSGTYVAGFTPDWTGSVILEALPGGKLADLIAANLDGSQKEFLDSPVPYEFFDLAPVISPDGKKVAYLHLDISTQTSSLVVIGLDGSERQVLFSGEKSNAEGTPPGGLPLAWLSSVRLR